MEEVSFFFQFTFKLWKTCFGERPAVVLLYDSHALFGYWLIRHLIPCRPFIWYHNHDIAEANRLKLFSVGWMALKAEKRIFPTVGLFTLPAAERLVYFPVAGWHGKTIIVPNYPAISVFKRFYSPRVALHIVSLIFQGRIDDSHGIEKIIPLLSIPIKNRKLELVLKGYCDPQYKETLIQLARTWNAEDDLKFEGFTPYLDVPKLSSRCHIGIGIFEKKEVMHLTLGTASNKLYEYAAVGLPVIYNSAEHFDKYLTKFAWAFPVKVSSDSIRTAIEAIIDEYASVSAAAVKSFTDDLNFERVFQPVIDYLSSRSLL